MAYGDVLVHTNGPSYGQNIVRNVGVSSGGGGGGAPDAHAASHEDGGADELDLTGLSGGFQNPFPDPVTFEQDVALLTLRTLWFDTAKANGLRWLGVDGLQYVGGNGSFSGTPGSGFILQASPGTGHKVALWDDGSNMELDAGADDILLQGAAIRSQAPHLFTDSTTGGASANIPPGVAPTAPNDGDIWVDAAGDIFLQRAGVTKQFMFV